MSDQSDLAATTFRDLLHRAVTSGQRPRRTLLLGPATWAAIDALACEHPDATPDHFAAAYDAFALEHRHAEEMRALYDADPLTARAAEYAAIDALVGQLRISYPAVDPDTIDSVVRHLHAGFDGHAVRDFVPLFVERAAHQRFA